MNQAKLKAAVFYSFFPHYRKAVIEKMDTSQVYTPTFFGSAEGIHGIRTHVFKRKGSFVPVRNFYFGKVLFQPSVVMEALKGRHDVYVFLADPNIVTTWLGAAICRVRGKRVVFWGHGFMSAAKTRKNLLRKTFFRLAHGFYTYGRRAKENAIELGFDAQEIYVGFNSLDYDGQIKLRQPASAGRSALPGCDLRVVCVSRLTAACRYDLLLEAMAIAERESGLKSSVTFVGSGPCEKDLASLAESLGVNASFLGAIYEEEKIARIVQSCDVTVQPGKIGLTAMHSMMYGIPVISHDALEFQMPEVEAIVDGYTGSLFKRDSAQDLAEKLSSFATKFSDTRLTRQRCFEVIDVVYNPGHQAEIMDFAVLGAGAPEGNDMQNLFGR